jgi:osmotically-inducible protein OsmY
MKTDEQLKKDVYAALAWDPSIHAAQIGVTVKDGQVTLLGEVSSFVEKWNAESAAQRVSGTKATTFAMTVKLSAFGKRNDADIAKSAQIALDSTAGLPEDAFQVMVEAAFDAVRHLVGVTGVENCISIRPTTALVAIEADIESALKAAVATDANEISVALHGCDLTLSGKVANWDDRERVTRLAWGTPGVRHVLDNMTLRTQRSIPGPCTPEHGQFAAIDASLCPGPPVAFSIDL